MSDKSRPFNRESDRAVVAQRQALRLQRFYMAAATYSLTITAAIVADRLGLGHMSARFWAWFLGLIAVGNLGFWVIFKSGLNRSFDDASLTREQIMFALACGLVPLYAIPNARAIILMFFLVPFSFGMLRLRRRQYISVAVMVMSMYGSMLLLERGVGKEGFDLGYELYLYLLFGILLTWFAVFGGYVSDLRARLGRKNRVLEQTNERIARISVTDELTRLYNRRHAFDVMKQVHANAVAGQGTYTLAILDIDHFKSVNDLCGHQRGDQVLTHFSTIVADGLRSSDMLLAQTPDQEDPAMDAGGFLARYGGEEFILLFANTTEAQAAACLNRIREQVKAYTFAGEREIHISFSGGVAAFRKGDSLEKVISRADRSLYRAKAQGRDQVAMDQSSARSVVDTPVPGLSEES